MRATSTLVVAAASRACAIALAIVSAALIPAHEPDGALEHSFGSDCRGVSRLAAAFTRWDAAHFLAVAADGWEGEDFQHAFFPLYPLLMRGLARLLAPLPLCAEALRVVAGLLLSNGAFVVAAVCLDRLGRCVLRDPQLARVAARLFCVAPASVFFSSLYAESCFAATTFGGLLLLERESPWAASACLALATGCRANGVLGALPVAFAGARRIYAHWALAAAEDGATPPMSERATTATWWWQRRQWRRGVVWAWLGVTVAAQVGLVVAPYAAWQVDGMQRVCGRHRVLAALAPWPLAARAPAPAPTIASSWSSSWSPSWAPRLRAFGGAVHAAAIGDGDAPGGSAATHSARPTPTRIAHRDRPLPAGWCERIAPDLYAHVQHAYWGVGLFRYYQLRQLPNFALAAPALALCAAGCAASVAALIARCARLSRAEWPRVLLGRRADAELLCAKDELHGMGERCAEADSVACAPPMLRALSARCAARAGESEVSGLRGTETAQAAPRRRLASAARHELEPHYAAPIDDAGEPSLPMGEGALATQAFVLVVHWALLSAISLLVANVQVKTPPPS